MPCSRLASSALGLLLLSALAAPSLGSDYPSAAAQRAAVAAAREATETTIETLRELVAFPTVGNEEGSNANLEVFVRFREHLRGVAGSMGFDFADHGDVVVIGLGDGPERLGLVTHGDVKAAEAALWARDPFELDLESEPGLLVGRGTEDDKGAIAVALHAMAAVAGSGSPLTRRIELIISLTEETDWTPFMDFLVANPPPSLNIVFDSNYPVTVAEKGWGEITPRWDVWRDGEGLQEPWLADLQAGVHLSQVPGSARVRVVEATDEVEAALRRSAADLGDPPVELRREGGDLWVEAQGVATHSGSPQHGINALTRLAAVLGARDWPPTAAAGAVRLLNDLVGLGDYGERFGDLAHADDLMGPLTLTAARVRVKDWKLELGISFRRPSGRERPEVVASILDTLARWEADQPEGLAFRDVEIKISKPMDQRSAPQVPVLLEIYRHYMQQPEATPVGIGGGTHAKLLPGAVSFGPARPDTPYTGHSEHEFVTREQLVLNLRMMTAALMELATDASGH